MNLKNNNSFIYKKKSKRHKKIRKKFDFKHYQFILKLLENQNKNLICRKQIKIEFEKKFTNEELKISLTQISRMIKANNYSYKRTVPTFENQISPLIPVVKIKKNISDIIQYLNNDFNLITIDQSTFCINSCKNYGFGKKGKKLRCKSNFRSKKLNLISAIFFKKNCHIFSMITNENTNSKTMKYFFLKIYSILIKKGELLEKTVILLDIAPVHKSKIIKELHPYMNFYYITPYTPFLNSTEDYFLRVKTLYRDLNQKFQNSMLSLESLINSRNEFFFKKIFLKFFIESKEFFKNPSSLP